MTVSLTTPAQIYPIFRVPGMPQNNPSILGRVFQYALIAGDASGGVVIVYFSIPSLHGIFGPYACMQLDTMTLKQAPVAVAQTFWRMDVMDGVPGYDGVSYIDYTIENASGIGSTGPSGIIVPKALLRGPQYEINIVMSCSINTNGTAYQFGFHGLVLDERMI